MEERTFAEKVIKKTEKDVLTCNKMEHSGEQYYSHPTFCIKNLSEYIHLVTIIASINNDDSFGETVIFRGISDKDYDLTPGLARMKSLNADTEANLINDFLVRRPDAFNGLTDFDIMSKMQHYGLPTRLLDFTLNPLVALYFACESKNNKKGRILCHSTYVKNDSDVFAKGICSAAFRKAFDENYTIDEYLCDDKLTLHKYLTEAYLCGETTVIRPKYWNQRIANQAGVFMVFPNELIDRYKSVLIHSDIGVVYAIGQYGFGHINANIIEDILKVEPINYYAADNSDYLTDECLKIMLEAHKNKVSDEIIWDKIKQYFENRFKISHRLKALGNKEIENSFCSIIVEPNSKKKILRELSYIGFGVDFIYPELEYTAKEVKSRYE